jgi:hypothetical protein
VPLQELEIARELPLAVELDDRPHLSVGRRVREVPLLRAERDAGSEHHEAGVVGVVLEVHFPHRALERGKEKRERLLVVPDVRAVEGTTAVIVAGALEA